MENILPSNDDIAHLEVTELAAALQCVPVGITIFDRDLRLRYWNEACLRLLDFPRDFLTIDTTLADIFRFNARRGEYGPGDQEEHVRQRMALARKFEAHQFMRTRPDGTVLEISGQGISDGLGTMTGFVTIYRDVTRETRQEHQLKAANKELLTAYEEFKKLQGGTSVSDLDVHRQYRMAACDGVTDLFSKVYIEDVVARLVELRNGGALSELSLAVFAIKDFDNIQASYGRLGCDAILRRVGAILNNASRKVDVPVRFGGNRLGVFLTGLGARDGGVFAENIQRSITAIRFEQTLSALTPAVKFGVIEHRLGESLPDFIERANSTVSEESASAVTDGIVI